MVKALKSLSRTANAILDGAELAFREVGFSATSMEEIARRSGVARATIYYNFESKEEIAVGIAERYRQQGYVDLLKQQTEGLGTIELLNNFFEFAGNWIANNRDAAFIGTTAAIRGVGRSENRPGTAEVFEGLVQQGQSEGVLRIDLLAPVLARLLGGLLIQAALVGSGPTETEVRKWPLTLLGATLQGLLSEDVEIPNMERGR